MSRNDRTPTDVTVTVLDLTDTLAEALDYLRAHAQVDIDRGIEKQMPSKVDLGLTWGVVETPDGSLYALCTEGVGPDGPITDENKLAVEIFVRGYEGDGEKQFISMFPACSVKLTPAMLRERATGDKINLAIFVRTFGARLEANYESWRRTLTREGVATA